MQAPSGLTVSATGAGLRWAPADTANLGPGVQTYTGGRQCTANFVFTDAAKHVYLGQAAHCAGLGEGSQTNGCRTTSRPLGTKVTFNKGGSTLSGGRVIGTGELAYSSWRTMRDRHEADASTCAYNDLALVEVNPKYVDKVNPSVPFWGGPVGVDATGLKAADTLYLYGDSSLRGGNRQLSPQKAYARPDDPSVDGWRHDYVSRTPGIPGDSGSAWMDSQGRAIGTLSTVGLAVALVNTLGDLHKELMYARQHSGIKGLRLVLGSLRFSG